MRTWPWEVLSLLCSQETCHSVGPGPWVITTLLKKDLWEKLQIIHYIWSLEFVNAMKTFPSAWMSRWQKPKSGRKALQRGRYWTYRVSAACPVRQWSVWRWPNDRLMSIMGLFWPCQVSVLAALNPLICPGSNKVSAKATRWSSSFQQEQWSPQILTYD